MTSPQSNSSHRNDSQTPSSWHTARESPVASISGQEPSTPQPSAAPSSSSPISTHDMDEVEELGSFLQEHDQLWSLRKNKQAQKDSMASQGQTERSSCEQHNKDSEDEQMATVSDHHEDEQIQAADEHSIRPGSEPANAILQGEVTQLDLIEEYRKQELRIQELRNLRRQARKQRDQEKTRAKAAWTERKAKLEEELDALYTEYAGGFCSRVEIDEQKAVIERAKAERKAQKASELEEWKAKLTEFSEINADESTDEIEDELWLNRTL